MQQISLDSVYHKNMTQNLSGLFSVMTTEMLYTNSKTKQFTNLGVVASCKNKKRNDISFNFKQGSYSSCNKLDIVQLVNKTNIMPSGACMVVIQPLTQAI